MRKDRPKKCMEVIRKDMRACGINKYMVRGKKRWKKRYEELTSPAWDKGKNKEKNFKLLTCQFKCIFLRVIDH